MNASKQPKRTFTAKEVLAAKVITHIPTSSTASRVALYKSAKRAYAINPDGSVSFGGSTDWDFT
jgi:hypothetical protein